MYILISESRGAEYASMSKTECRKAQKKLEKDDIRNGYTNAEGKSDETYYIDEVNDGAYEEGWQ